MEALVFFVFFGLYILIRVLFGGGESAWEKQSLRYQDGIRILRGKNYSEAKQYFEVRLRKRPYDFLLLVCLGEIALQQDETERALAYGSQALRLDNTIWQAHLLMTRATYALGSLNEAEKHAGKSVWFGREEADCHHWFGKILLENGNILKGLKHLAQAYRLGDEDAGPLLRKYRYSPNL